MKEKKCKRCGDLFLAKGKQMYCGKEKIAVCLMCGKEFSYICGPTVNSTCSSQCAIEYSKQQRAAALASSVRRCKWCGEEFTPKTAQEVYCHRVHYQICAICGKQFEIDVRKDNTVQTCSAECKKKLQSQNHDYAKGVETQRASLLAKYGVDNIAKIPGSSDKAKATNLQKYGTTSYSATEEYKQRVKETCLEKYGVEHHLKSSKVIAKRELTCLNRYQSTNIFSSEYGKQLVKKALYRKYGVINPSQNPESKRRATRAARQSKLEQRVKSLLSEYRIEFIQHHIIQNADKTASHEYDFYIPKYKLLVDCDGLYYHGYLDDPNGKQVLDYYDETRIALVPQDHIFHVIVEGQEDKDMKYISDIMHNIDAGLFDYDGALFKWCRSIGFPQPSYSIERMLKDYSHLCRYHSDTYSPSARLGSSAINHFHKSIYDAHVGNYPSPREAWYDDKLLKKVIHNRLIYKNDVDPHKVLKGFNISKICPRVSLFNPVLAKYLIEKYLNEFNVVFDPFSGFSGRLLGCAAAEKQYIGQDLNPAAVAEAGQIIKALELQNVSVSVKNILDDTGTYDCLLTCPPYGTKEHYADETVFKSCDEWIDEILHRFKCKRYVVVVDNTNKYKECVTEEIRSTSHFNKTVEYVVVIDG